MSLTEHEVDIRTGRRDGDGHVRVSIFAGDLVALTLEGHGERAPTLLLTLEQARRLQRALAELIPIVEESERKERAAGTWQGEERRRRKRMNAER
ncbi:MAG TPA: hypothetical protein VGN95_08710 [Pyrinomonadaceae bacterium]|jgi:hypothetical protein|nr:hypothetical protein [Pyrinomonadaceae bacterium]